MKHLVNGEETELSGAEGVEVSRLFDRLIVRTADGAATALAVRKGDTTYVSYKGRSYKIEKVSRSRHIVGGESNGECRAPMPGQIVEITANVGDALKDGDRVLILEAMKMQQSITAPHDGTLQSVGVAVGDQVDEGQLLAVVQPDGEE